MINIHHAPNLGAMLAQTRKEKGFSQQTLSQKAAIELPALCQYENGTAQLTLEAFVKLSDALGLCPFDILDRSFKHPPRVVITT